MTNRLIIPKTIFGTVLTGFILLSACGNIQDSGNTNPANQNSTNQEPLPLLPVKSGFTTIDTNKNTGIFTCVWAKSQKIIISYVDNNSDGSPNRFKVAVSTNGGQSWSLTNLANLTVTTVDNSLVSDGTNVYLAYNYSGLSFRSSPDFGQSWTAQSKIENNTSIGSYPSLYLEGGRLHALYCNSTSSSLKTARSDDGGVTWPDAWKTNVATDSIGYYNSLLVEGTSLYASYQGKNNALTYFPCTDTGLTWSTNNRKLLDQTFNAAFYTSIAKSGNTICIAYCNDTSNSVNIARSPDNGLNWTVSIVDKTSDSSGMAYSTLASEGQDWYLTYFDSQYKDLKLAHSSDDGLHWTLSTIESTNWVGEFNSLAVDQGRLFVTYYDRSNGDLILAVSTNKGQTWQ